MKIQIGDQFTVLNPAVLNGYYDSTFNGEILTVTSSKVAKVRNSGGSNYFAILTTGKYDTHNSEIRFSVSLDQINRENFKRVK